MDFQISVGHLIIFLLVIAVAFLLFQQWKFYNSNEGTVLRLFGRYVTFAWKNKEFGLSIYQTLIGAFFGMSVEKKFSAAAANGDTKATALVSAVQMLTEKLGALIKTSVQEAVAEEFKKSQESNTDSKPAE
jgi:hypothetical protein